MTTQDMVALRKARAIIEDVAPRTAFGRSVNYIEDRFDGKKCVLGYYEASENLSPSEREEYIVEACNYLNNLNEHFHLDGYHFDMSGITEGKLYFAKDVEDWDEWAFNSSDGEYSYMEECAYRQYLANKAEVQHKLQLMVNEAMIIVDEESDYASKLNQLMSIQEGVSDTVSDAWTKFKNFLGKIWAKFTEFISRTFNSDKNYLDKYKDIILNKPYQLENSTIDDDYFTGMQRLSTYQVSTPTAQDIDKIKIDEKSDAGRVEAQKEIVRQTFKNAQYTGAVDFSDFCKNYFKGARDPNATSANKFDINTGNMNMTTVFNYCYNYQKLSNNLNKNRVAMEKAGEAFIALAKELNDAPAANEADKTSGGTGETAKPEAEGKQQGQEGQANQNVDQAAQDLKADADKIRGASFIAYGKFGPGSPERQKIDAIKSATSDADVVAKYKEAKPFISNPLSGLKTVKESFIIAKNLGLVLEDFTVGKSSGTGGTNTSKSNVKPDVNKFGNMANNTTIRQSNGVGGNLDAKNFENEADLLIKRVNLYSNTCGTIFAGMCTAAQTIHKDFMKLIKAHVSSYLGDKETPDQAARAAASYSPEQMDINKVPVEELKKNLAAAQARKDDNTPQGREAVAQALNAATANMGNTRSFNSIEDLEGYIKSVEEQKAKAAQANQQNQGNG